MFSSPAIAGDGRQGLPDRQSTDNLDPALLAMMRQQEALQPAVDLLSAEMKSGGRAGFTSLAFEDSGLTLYWKGPLTAGVAIAIQKSQKFGRITVRPAKYSMAELEEVAGNISKHLLNSDIAGIILKHDGSGLEIGRMDPATAEKVRAKAPDKKISTMESILEKSELRGVPITKKEGMSAANSTACAYNTCKRRDDQSAWNGGTYLDIPNTVNGGHCTSGFGVWKGGVSYLVTASHCANPSNYFRDYTGEYIGGVYMDSWRLDIMLINARGWGKIFDGDKLTHYSKAVKSAGDVVINEWLCQSGSTSGTVCWLQTMQYFGSLWVCDSDNDCFYIEGMIQALQGHGLPGAAFGDSGGPVFTLDGDGVRMKGIVTAGDVPRPQYIYYQDWPTISTQFGLSGVVTR